MPTLFRLLKISWNAANTRDLSSKLPVDLLEHVAGAVYQPEVAGVQILEQPFAPELTDHWLVFTQQAEIGHDQLDSDDVVAVLVGTVHRRLDALLEIGHQVAGIAAKNLIATLPAENHLDVLGGQL